jgi:hypothetical protein
MGTVGLSPVGRTYTSFMVLLSPFDELFPRVAARAGNGAEAREISPCRLATQVVFDARRELESDSAAAT